MACSTHSSRVARPRSLSSSSHLATSSSLQAAMSFQEVMPAARSFFSMVGPTPEISERFEASSASALASLLAALPLTAPRGGLHGNSRSIALLHLRLLAAGEDVGDAHDRQLGAEAALALRVLAATLLEGDDLLAARLLDDLAGDGDVAEEGRAEVDLSPSVSISTSPKATVSPGSPTSLAMVISSFAATRNCLPPVLMTANIIVLHVQPRPVVSLFRRGARGTAFWQSVAWLVRSS